MKIQQFDLPDGTHTAIEWFGDKTISTRGLIVFLPALGVNVEYYRGFANAWSRYGYRVAAVEMRGMKQSSVWNVERQNFGYKEVLNIDLATLMGCLSQEAAGRPLYLAGHSLGGQFALLYASRFPEKIAGVIVLAGGSNYYGSITSWGKQCGRYCSLCLMRGIDRALGFFPGDRLGFGGKQPQNMMLDWTHEALTGRYRVIGDETDYDAALEKLEKPVMLLSLSGDPVVPRSCADFLACKLKKARVTQLELQAKDYGLQAFNHFSWTRRPKLVLEPIEAWMWECVNSIRYPISR